MRTRPRSRSGRRRWKVGCRARCATCGTSSCRLSPVLLHVPGDRVHVGRAAGDGDDLHLHGGSPSTVAAELADVVPYVSGVIELDGTQGAGARMILRCHGCDPDAVRIGDKVEIWFDQISDTYAMPRARPAAGRRNTPGVTNAGRPRRVRGRGRAAAAVRRGPGGDGANGYQDAAVADILTEAGLWTRRSSYRHFESRDQLLCALYRREAELAAAAAAGQGGRSPPTRACVATPWMRRS